MSCNGYSQLVINVKIKNKKINSNEGKSLFYDNGPLCTLQLNLVVSSPLSALSWHLWEWQQPYSTTI